MLADGSHQFLPWQMFSHSPKFYNFCLRGRCFVADGSQNFFRINFFRYMFSHSPSLSSLSVSVSSLRSETEFFFHSVQDRIYQLTEPNRDRDRHKPMLVDRRSRSGPVDRTSVGLCGTLPGCRRKSGQLHPVGDGGERAKVFISLEGSCIGLYLLRSSFLHLSKSSPSVFASGMKLDGLWCLSVFALLFLSRPGRGELVEHTFQVLPPSLSHSLVTTHTLP